MGNVGEMIKEYSHECKNVHSNNRKFSDYARKRTELETKYGHEHSEMDLIYVVLHTIPLEVVDKIKRGEPVEFKTEDMKFENFRFTGDELKFTAIALDGTAYMECKCTPTTKQYRQKNAIFASPAQIFNIFNEACYAVAMVNPEWKQAVTCHRKYYQ